MKNFTPLFLAIAGVFTSGSFAQRSEHFPADVIMENAQLMPDKMSNDDLAVVAYHVEERINMNFGSSITTYEVSNINLINTNELGGNNTRVVTPKYGKAKPKVVAVTLMDGLPRIDVAFIHKAIEFPTKVTRTPPKSVNIDILSTYERVIDKGYKSVDMLKRVANARYFADDLVVAAKYYVQLFELTTDLEPVVFFRYAQSLKAVNQMDKASEIMAIYEKMEKK